MDVRVDLTSGQRQRAAERAVLSTSSIGLLAGALGTIADGAGPPGDRRAAAALAARDLERHLDDLSDSGDPEDDQVVLEVEAVVERLRRAAVG